MKFLNYEGLGYLIEELKIKFQQQEAGKELTSNDFTNILKEKLDGIETGAQVNTIDSVNGEIGNVVITSDDIDFLSSVSGATATTVRAIIDNIIAKDKAQDTQIDKKADKTSVYTKQEIDDQLDSMDTGVVSVNDKTGVVTLKTDDLSDVGENNKFVTDSEKSEWSGKASVGYVDTEVAKKVDKVQGKGLSTHDLTTALKNKLDGIESGAEVNKISLIKKNGVNLSITDKTVNIEVPTKVGELTNDKDFQTKAEVQALIVDQGKLKKEIVVSLPTAADADDNILYLVRNKENTGYEEWMVINGAWEILGDTAAVDFTGYVHEDDIQTISNAEIDAFLQV